MKSFGSVGGVLVGLVLLLASGPAAAECDSFPNCQVPECSSPANCMTKTWPLTCSAPPDGDGWWECCEAIDGRTRCCVPVCPEVSETETGSGGDEDHPAGSGGSDSGGCSAAGGALSLWGVAALLGVLGVRGRRRG